jgi:5-hydroxyisourate hydrolase-like protein (transthyretin family)
VGDELAPGVYRLAFATPPSAFFLRVELEIELTDGHYHVPLIVSPYSCASYRGS